MKPRSIVKTIQWFPHFAALEGEDWNYTYPDRLSAWGNKKIYPTRRKYIYSAHGESLMEVYPSLDDYLSGKSDTNETESSGRNDKTSFEFYGFGFVDQSGKVRATKAGHLIRDGKMQPELLLKQLLKIQFPSPANHKKSSNGTYVFPMEIILEVFKHFDYLNKFELGFLFGCTDMAQVDKTIAAIKEFRKAYSEMDNKLDTTSVKKMFNEIFKRTYPQVTNKPETYYGDYADALIRCLEYTGLFLQRGRGFYVKLYIPEHSKLKVKLLQEKYSFAYNGEEDFEKYMEWFGNPYNINLPWENRENRKVIISDKTQILKTKLNQEKAKIPQEEQQHLTRIIADFKDVDQLETEEELTEAELALSKQLVSVNETLFTTYYAKTEEARAEIMEKFIDIIEGNEDMAALWLECNTWKSLVAIDGEHRVKRNFKLEEDLTPRAFAPGQGNTPDMELYFEDNIIIPEVSLMTGVRQWEHEGSSVIDHVYKFINNYPERNVIGLFISSKINVRTMWQFYILNRESWVGKAVPVIPLTIKQYLDLVAFVYQHKVEIQAVIKLLQTLRQDAFNCTTYSRWEEKIPKSITTWKRSTA